MTYEDWFKLAKTMIIIDISLTIVVPFIVILTVNISISMKLMQVSLCHRRNATMTQSRSSSSASSKRLVLTRSLGSTSTQSRQSLNNVTMRMSRDHNNETRRETQFSSNILTNSRNCDSLLFVQHHLNRPPDSYSRTTRFLVLISITYFLLNVLMAYTKLSYLFEHDQHTDHVAFDSGSFNHEVIERLSCYLYYLNFSINFFLYVFNKSSFQAILIGIFRRSQG